jgi:hypothetical protein
MFPSPRKRSIIDKKTQFGQKMAMDVQKNRNIKRQTPIFKSAVKMQKSSPPYEGGVADAAFQAADGVVLTSERKLQHEDQSTKNHPVGEAPTPLLRKEGSQSYRIVGEPEDLEGARQLATEDRYQFQW